MMFMFLVLPALAGSTAGMGISPMGGGFGGITEPGVLGLGSTPAAAKAPQSEVGLDFGLSTWTIDAHLDGQTPVQSNGLVPTPYFGAALPVGDFGIGLLGSVPFGGGGEFPEDGAQRFHLREGRAYLMEGSIAVAYQPIDALRIGISGRMTHGTMTKRYAVDPTGLVYSQMGEDMSSLSDDERPSAGTQELDITGRGYGYAVGISSFLSNGIEVHASYRSPMPVDMSGPATVVPSEDFNLSMTGTAYTKMVYPREVSIGLVIPTKRVRLILDGGWTDWSTMERVDGTLENVSIESDDEGLSALLQATGASESSLTEPQRIYNDLGNTQVFYGGAAIDIPLHARWTARTGLWWAPTSIPDETFHVGIVDFEAWDLRGAMAWQPSQSMWVAVSADWYFIPDRDINDSQLSLDNSNTSGRVLPSANGEYAMTATRYGLSLVYRY